MASSSAAYSTRQLKQAVEWFVRLQSEHCLAQDRLDFEIWLEKNDSHRAAYAEAEKVWVGMDNLKWLPVPGLAEARSAKPRKPAAASLAIVLLTTALLTGTWLEYSAETLNYATRLGERRRIELADNSHIDLNTDSRISVKISLLQRKVVLTQGEALFDVKHNVLRPFTVQAGDLRVRDVGTRFNIRKQNKGATVSVLAGEVELSNGQGVINKALTAGKQQVYRETSVLGLLETVQAETLTAWVNGQLVFKHTPLHEVTAELERYHPVHFTFADPQLAQKTLSGTFNTDDLGPFLHALETILPVQAKQNGRLIQLRRVSKK